MRIQGRAIFFVIISFLLQEVGLVNVWSAGDLTARSQTTASRQSKALPDVKPARLRDEVNIQMAGPRKPYLPLGDGRALLADYADETGFALQSLREQAEARALTSGDYDEDGMPDLVSAYATKTGGVITIHRGNVDAVYPNSPAARRHKAEGTFSDAPFLSPAGVFPVFESPDLIAAGDFDADGHLDLVAAQRGSSTIQFLRGDGTSAMAPAEALVSSGAITALASGDTNRADGLTDLAVAVQTTAGARLLVFEGISGAVKSQPEEVLLPEAASALAMGYLNDDAGGDIAVAAGRELLIVHGRDRKLSLDAGAQNAVPAATISRRLMPARLTSLAIGDFTGDMGLELGAATTDGSVFLVSDMASNVNLQSAGHRGEELRIEPLAAGKGSSRAQLVGANFSGLNHETLLMADGANEKMYAWVDDNERRERGDITLTARPGEREEPVAFDVQGEPVAVLPMRLNRDGLNDLVVLRRGHTEPVILTTLISTFVVCNSSDCDTDGCQSLRDRINAVNDESLGSSNEITFDSQAFQNPTTISISDFLPPIDRATVIDGTSAGNCGGGVAQSVTPQALSTPVQITSSNFSNAFRITNSSCLVENFVINRVNNGITIDSNTSNNEVVGNNIGTNRSGTSALNNSGRGVFINNARNNLVGGNPNAGGINIICGNVVGLDINAGTDNQVRFNNIGAGAALNVILPNNLNVRITNGAARNRIGMPVQNSFDNAIWGSAGDGVLIDLARDNLVQSNWMRSNQGDGIEVRSSSGNTIGGTLSTAQSRSINFFWTNNGSGVNINGGLSTNNLIQANNLGVDFTANATPVNVGNASHGVLITDNASNNSVGSPTGGLGNFIAFNLLNGVTVISGVGNLIASNSIFNNAKLGIDLGNDGPDTNDPLDADGGPNNHQNFPIINSATVPGVPPPGEVAAQAVASISGTMTGERNTTYTLEFRYCSLPCDGSGHQFAGCTPSKLLLAGGLEPTVTTDDNGMKAYSFQFDLPNNATTGYVNAQARKNSASESSEISPCQQINTSSQSGDFSLGFEAATVTALAGGKTRITVIITRTGGFAGAVTVTPAPKFNGIKPKPPDPVETTEAIASFKYKIAEGVGPETRQLTFTGRDASGRTRTATATLIVQ